MIIAKLAFCIAASGAAGYAMFAPKPAPSQPVAAHQLPVIDLAHVVNAFRR